MNIVLNRVDDRLVHGQILTSWVRKLQVRQILVIDDQLVTDPLMETVLKMSVPPDVELKILDIPRGSGYIAANQDGSGPNAILLMKNPTTAMRLWELGYRPESLNIGGMAAGPDRRQLRRGIYASNEEIDLFRRLDAAGTRVYIQVVYAESKLRISDLT